MALTNNRSDQPAATSPATDGVALLVDDNPVIRQIYRRALELHKFKVVESENGGHALLLLDNHQPNIIVLDLMMAGMDGFQFLTQLRRRTNWQNVPVIVLSAKPLSESERILVSTLAQHFQRKGEVPPAAVATLARQLVPATAA
ncbi:MAG: response regulator [Proteobacteria bacterium]|nr:response regulator [Pseudomonadota bacterium]